MSLFDSSSSGSNRLLDVREVNNGPDDTSGGDGDLPIPCLEVSTCLTNGLLCTPSPAATLSRTNVPGMNVNSSLGSTHSPLRFSVEILVGIRSSSAVSVVRERTPARLIWENEGDPLSRKLYTDIWSRQTGYGVDVSQRNSTLSSGASLYNATGNNNNKTVGWMEVFSLFPPTKMYLLG